uniref:MSP domain-containing protein n=1 Tax=Steinernema glaseri TaxID=37863 RepID=A0A1I7ZCD8_9BILA
MNTAESHIDTRNIDCRRAKIEKKQVIYKGINSSLHVVDATTPTNKYMYILVSCWETAPQRQLAPVKKTQQKDESPGQLVAQTQKNI